MSINASKTISTESLTKAVLEHIYPHTIIPPELYADLEEYLSYKLDVVHNCVLNTQNAMFIKFLSKHSDVIGEPFKALGGRMYIINGRKEIWMCSDEDSMTRIFPIDDEANEQ